MKKFHRSAVYADRAGYQADTCIEWLDVCSASGLSCAQMSGDWAYCKIDMHVLYLEAPESLEVVNVNIWRESAENVISQPWPWARIFVSRHQLTNARSFKLTLIVKLWRIVCVIGRPSENCACLDAKIVVSLRNATLRISDRRHYCRCCKQDYCGRRAICIV
jgi:hypothetical protein